MSQGDPGGSAGIDDVAWLEHHELADVPNDVSDTENHVGGRITLTQHTVHRKLQVEVLRVRNLVGRYQPRAERIECFAVLTLIPLSASFELELTFRNVVGDRVAGDVRERVTG